MQPLYSVPSLWGNVHFWASWNFCFSAVWVVGSILGWLYMLLFGFAMIAVIFLLWYDCCEDGWSNFLCVVNKINIKRHFKSVSFVCFYSVWVTPKLVTGQGKVAKYEETGVCFPFLLCLLVILSFKASSVFLSTLEAEYLHFCSLVISLYKPGPELTYTLSSIKFEKQILKYHKTRL